MVGDEGDRGRVCEHALTLVRRYDGGDELPFRIPGGERARAILTALNAGSFFMSFGHAASRSAAALSKQNFADCATPHSARVRSRSPACRVLPLV